MSEFKASAHEWICSGCGKVDVWRDSWQYFGALGCRRCGQEPVIDFVTCSDACRDAFADRAVLPRTKTKRAGVA
jgi:hypothetical protein